MTTGRGTRPLIENLAARLLTGFLGFFEHPALRFARVHAFARILWGMAVRLSLAAVRTQAVNFARGRRGDRRNGAGQDVRYGGDRQSRAVQLIVLHSSLTCCWAA